MLKRACARSATRVVQMQVNLGRLDWRKRTELPSNWIATQGYQNDTWAWRVRIRKMPRVQTVDSEWRACVGPLTLSRPRTHPLTWMEDHMLGTSCYQGMWVMETATSWRGPWTTFPSKITLSKVCFFLRKGEVIQHRQHGTCGPQDVFRYPFHLLSGALKYGVCFFLLKLNRNLAPCEGTHSTIICSSVIISISVLWKF